MSVEIDGQTGLVLTETQDGCTQPGDYSFACVNDFVHRLDTQYEDLEALCLGMASHFEKLMATENVKWIHVNYQLPDDEMTVMLYHPDLNEPVWLGYVNQNFFYDAQGDQLPAGAVTHWAEIPHGPE